MGSVQRSAIPNARYGPGRRRWIRAGFHKRKNNPQQTGWKKAVYLLKQPSPIQRPVKSQQRRESCCTACHPAIMEAVQNKTNRQSTVSTTVPTANNGVAAE